MSILSAPAIAAERKSGNIVIEPYDPAQLNNTSYDVRLGKWYFMEKSKGFFHPEDISGWEGPYEIPSVLRLEPGECFLMHTQEFIGGVRDITTMIKAKSTTGRHNISVCMCAGWGDIGFANRWTLEVKNHSRPNPAFLKVGQRIAQIVFMRTTPLGDFPDYLKTGRYALDVRGKTYEELEKAWIPEMMLPQAERLKGE